MPTNPDLYRAPTLALLAPLVAVFGAICVQKRTQKPAAWEPRASAAPPAQRRQLLWLAGWIFVTIRLGLQFSGHDTVGVQRAVSDISMQLAGLMFLGSLAPQYLTRRPLVLYVVAFGLPLIVFPGWIAFDPMPGRVGHTVLVACTLIAIAVAARWSLEKHLLPEWISLLIVCLIGADCVWLTVRQQYGEVLTLVHSGVLLMTALLFASAFRRLTPGLLFTVGGLVAWSLPALLAPATGLPLFFLRAVNVAKLIAAVGMIVLVLEDEIASNQAAQLRDRRARVEMEKYTELYLAAMPFDEVAEQYNHICETIAAVSRFRQAAIFVRNAVGSFRLAGRAGMDGALEGALDSLAGRMTDEKIRRAGDANYFKQEIGHLMLMDLTPLMEPGDDLLQVNFREAHVIGIRSRDQRLLGALLLAGLRDPEEPLLTEDVLPLELLVARIGATREHHMLLRQLMQTERLTGLGQLAGGVAHELNNPLTVVTGYAELMAESAGAVERDQALVILNEARRMKQIIESLMRFRKASSSGRSLISVGLLLRDIDKLMRHDLESARIDLQLRIPEGLPRVRADGEQIRQVFRQVIKNAMNSMEELPRGAERRLNVEVAPVGKSLQIMFSDTGPGFAEPHRAFDPFFTTRHPGEGVGLGLSVCYAMIREHGGEISVVNLHPRGAAVVIELPAEEEPGVAARPGFDAAPPSAQVTDHSLRAG